MGAERNNMGMKASCLFIWWSEESCFEKVTYNLRVEGRERASPAERSGESIPTESPGDAWESVWSLCFLGVSDAGAPDLGDVLFK